MTEGSAQQVLIIDDDPSLGQALSMVFRKRGWSATLCADGAGAAEAFAGTAFDIALVDKNLPDISGVDLVRQVRESGNRVPIIMMTGLATVGSAVAVMELGIDAYIKKPFDQIFDVVVRAEEVVERHQNRAELRRMREAARQTTGPSETLEPRAAPAPPTQPPAPAHTRRKPATIDSGARIAQQPGGDLTFLVVSQTPEEAPWIVAQLRKGGSRVELVETTSDLRQGVVNAAADAVLLDCNLGAAILTQALKSLSALAEPPVVLITGPLPSLELAAALVEGGAAGFLQSPYGDGRDFRRRVEHLIERRQHGW